MEYQHGELEIKQSAKNISVTEVENSLDMI